MDSFESLVAMLLERDGFWVRGSVKVQLTKAEKVAIGKPSSPRWELDLVAYKGSTNEIRIIECKSFLDSTGVSLASLDGTRPQDTERYKLFHYPRLLRIVSNRLVAQLEEAGSCRRSPKVVLCLAAGKIRNEKDRSALRAFFKRKGWLLFDEPWLLERIRSLASSGYENHVAAVVAKLLERVPKAA